MGFVTQASLQCLALRFAPVGHRSIACDGRNFCQSLDHRPVKNKKVALVACMRKLLTMMNCMIRNNEIWRTSPEATA